MKRGDLILYKADTNWYDQLIARVTHGPYVHVGILLSEALCVAATRKGINYDMLPASDTLLTVIDINPIFHVDEGLQWAKSQIGKEYGWMDIFYQGWKFLNPNTSFQFGQRDHWDCSDFATRYLDHIGYDLPDMFSEPYCNTPNDIARLFGVLPPRVQQEVRV